MTILGKFFHWVAGVPAWISTALGSVDAEAKVIIPIAINIVEGIKKVMDSPVTDMGIAIAETALQNPADTAIINKVHNFIDTWLPVILLKLQKAEDIANITNLQDQLKAALNELKFSSDAAKQMFWNDFAGLALSQLTTGKITLQAAKVVIEDYYQTYVTKTAVAPAPVATSVQTSAT